jgi:hypothetical protein
LSPRAIAIIGVVALLSVFALEAGVRSVPAIEGAIVSSLLYFGASRVPRIETGSLVQTSPNFSEEVFPQRYSLTLVRRNGALLLLLGVWALLDFSLTLYLPKMSLVDVNGNYLFAFVISYVGVVPIVLGYRWWEERLLLSAGETTPANYSLPCAPSLHGVEVSYDFRDAAGAIYGGTRNVHDVDQLRRYPLVVFLPVNPNINRPLSGFMFHEFVISAPA